MLKVSVVVPVYNPGEFLRPCVDSLLAQTLPATEFEAIFVDDGSTDATPAYLDELARQHDNVTVLHQPNSGWPGKPRNVGIDAARGEYVFFCDNDDWLAPEALERLHGYAKQNGSDIVIGKMAGINRPVPQALFARSIPRATLESAPLTDSLTPHKLFRRAFLVEHGLRFPEGRRRLEDHKFVVAAYLAAQVISVYADQVCYYHIRRTDSSNAGFSRVDWDGYFDNLAEALDVVVAETGPGPLRHRLYRRWLQVEMVDRLSGRRFLRLSEEEAAQLFAAAHRCARRYFGEEVVRLLPPSSRAVARALLRGDLEWVGRLAQLETRWRLRTEALQVDWRGRRLQVAGYATLTDGEDPARAGDRLLQLLDPEDRPAAGPDALAGLVTLTLEKRRSGVRWPVPLTAHRVGAVTTFTVDLDPDVLAAGAPLTDGVWDLYLEQTVLGLRRRARLVLVEERSRLRPRRRSSPVDGRETALYLAKGGGISLDVGLRHHPELAPRPASPARPRAEAPVGWGRAVRRAVRRRLAPLGRRVQAAGRQLLARARGLAP